MIFSAIVRKRTVSCVSFFSVFLVSTIAAAQSDQLFSKCINHPDASDNWEQVCTCIDNASSTDPAMRAFLILVLDDKRPLGGNKEAEAIVTSCRQTA